MPPPGGVVVPCLPVKQAQRVNFPIMKKEKISTLGRVGGWVKVNKQSDNYDVINLCHQRHITGLK